VDLSKYQHSESLTIAASPEVVYDLVSDVTRMGEWSPVCTGGEWDDEGHVWFTGSNKNGELEWQTKCRVDVAERGREFTFTNCGFSGDVELVRWSYTFAPVDGGCQVTERWEVLPEYPAFIEKLLPNMTASEYLDTVVSPTRSGMQETLARLKTAAEAA
jgi:hypothetical protein